MRELREHERTLVSTVGMKITDHTHARLGNEGSLLLAELLSTRGRQIGDEGASLLELDELVRVAAACCR